MFLLCAVLIARPEDQGVANGLKESYSSLGFALGPIIGGLVVGQGEVKNYSIPFFLAGLLSFVMIWIMLAKRSEITPGKELGADL